MVATAPVVNLNGTSRQSLIDQNFDAYRAVQAAHAALCNAAPHGRDFQTQPAEVFRAAQREHAERLVYLGKIERELREIVEQLVVES